MSVQTSVSLFLTSIFQGSNAKSNTCLSHPHPSCMGYGICIQSDTWSEIFPQSTNLRGPGATRLHRDLHISRLGYRPDSIHQIGDEDILWSAMGRNRPREVCWYLLRTAEVYCMDRGVGCGILGGYWEIGAWMLG